MKIQELLTESMPRTLYHGTIKEFVPDILDHGLIPQVGKFTDHAYAEYREANIPLEDVVFAADKQGLGKCVSAIIGQMRHHFPKWDMHHGTDDPTARDFYDHAALLVLKHAGGRFQHRSDPLDQTHPTQFEPGDYYHRGADLPNFVLTDNRLRTFLNSNGVRLDDFGIPDVDARRTDLIRLHKQGRLPAGMKIPVPAGK